MTGFGEDPDENAQHKDAQQSEVRSWPKQSRALLVGMANSDPRLPQAEASLTVVRNALTGSRGIFRAEHCRLLRNPSTPDVILNQVREAGADAPDVLLLYVVAHLGINVPTNTPKLATNDVRPDDLMPEGLSLDELLRAVDASAAQVRIVLLDCVARPHKSAATQEWQDRYLTKASRSPGMCLAISETRAGNLPGEWAQQATVFARELSDLLTGAAERSSSALTVQQVAERLERRRREHRPPLSVRWQFDEHAAEQVLSRARPQVPLGDGVLTTLANRLSGVLPRRRQRAPRPPRGPLFPRPFRFPPGTRRGRAIIVAVAAVVLLAVASVVAPLVMGPTACKPPLELRVLASPESFPAIKGAADQYSGERLDDDCRTVHLSVYQAPTDAVLRAFGQADQWVQPGGAAGTGSPCTATEPIASEATTPDASGQTGLPIPSRDVGPQPDIWFPDSVLDVQRAKACLSPGSSTVSFAAPVSVARSPLVLGVPEARRGFPSPGQMLPWRNLLDYVKTAKLNLIRPNPTTSTAGLLHSIGLYKAVTGLDGQPSADGDLGAVRDIESSMVGQGVSMADTEDLLCDLKPDQPVPAVLVSERALLSYNMGELPGCPGAPGQGRHMLAYYPQGFLVLDYPAVQVTWASQTGDGDRRRAATQGLQDWLLSDTGQHSLTRHGLRPAREDVTRYPAGPVAKPQGGAWQDVPLNTVDSGPSEREAQSAIDYYVQVRAPGQAVFLLDVSSSMAAQGNVDTAKRLIAGATELMGPGDDAALMTVPTSLDDPGPQPRAPQYADAAGLRAQLAGAALLRNDAALYQAIEVALRAMDSGDAAAKRALVLVTDGEDINDDGGAQSRSQVDQVLGGVSTPTAVPVHVLALSPGVCDARNFAGLLASESGGQCVTTIDSATTTKLGASIFAGSN